MNRLLRWLDGVLVRQEQIDELHAENRLLRAENEAITRINNDIAEQLYEAHADLLEHSHGACAIARGTDDRI